MKSLYFLRHAKSDWADTGLPDHDRPLAPRGREAAARLATYVAKVKLCPQLVLCSTALRARQTYEALSGALGDPESSFEGWLYGASPQEVLARLQQLPEHLERVLLVGHNPVFAELVASLAGDGEAAALSQLEDNFPTGALATLTFDGPWAGLAGGLAYLESIVVPRGLAST